MTRVAGAPTLDMKTPDTSAQPDAGTPNVAQATLGPATGSAPTTPIPGIKACHRWITDTCRKNRGDVGAMSEAASALQLELLNLYKHWPTGQGTRFHLVLTVEPLEPNK